MAVTDTLPSPAPFSSWTRALEPALDALLQSHAQLLFARSPAVGALVLLATALVPRMLLAGAASVLLATAVARALRFAPEDIRSGLYGYNALLVGLGVAAMFPPTPMAVGLGLVAVVATVLLTAALQSALGSVFGLPVLTLPFLTVYGLVAVAGPLAEIPLRSLPGDGFAASLPLPELLRAGLRCLGSVLFLPRADVGAVLLLALALHSRVAVALATLAFALVAAFATRLFVLHDPAMVLGLGLNGILVAIALGGVWFVPSAGSYALALFGVLLGGAIYLGAGPLLARAGLPVAILPFNLTVVLVLYALRQRVSDGRPQSVAAPPGTPEENLARHRTRVERAGTLHGLRFAPPFAGAWTCTQGVAGGITHAGPWRDALDFERHDPQGHAFRATGAVVTDFHAWHQPVLATAAGVVARVVDGVRDNAVGELNLDENWGNVVIVYHAPGVYSCVAHLARGTVAVREGEPVAAGQLLGRCGNSGRSATPHVHFQLQATDRLGAPTLPIALHDVVATPAGGGATLHAAHVPVEGTTVRALEPDAGRAAALRFRYGEALQATTTGPRGTVTENVTPDIDPRGRLYLRSEARRAALPNKRTAAGLTLHEVTGEGGTVLHLVRLALARVPFDVDDALVWTDRVPLRPWLPAWRRLLFDLVSPFGGETSFPVVYCTRRVGRSLLVEGASLRGLGACRPWVLTRAWITPEAGLVRLEARVGGVLQRVEFLPQGAAREAVTAPVIVAAATGGMVHAQS